MRGVEGRAGAEALLPFSSHPRGGGPPLPLQVFQNLGPAFGCLGRHVTGIIIRAGGGEGRLPPPAERGSRELSPPPPPPPHHLGALPEVGGHPGRAAGARRLLQLANEVSCATRAAAGASVGAEGGWAGRGPPPPQLSPTSAWLGPSRSPGRCPTPPHSQAESHTASTAPTQWFLLGSLGRRGWSEWWPLGS